VDELPCGAGESIGLPPRFCAPIAPGKSLKTSTLTHWTSMCILLRRAVRLVHLLPMDAMRIRIDHPQPDEAASDV
jgi:hypothetical protein